MERLTVFATDPDAARAKRAVRELLTEAGFGLVDGDLDAEAPDDAGTILLVASKIDDAALGALRRLRGDGRHSLLVVTGRANGRAIRAALAEGARGIVLQDELERCLASAVRDVQSGQLSLPAMMAAHLARPRLSPREKQVLALVVMGFSNAEIASQLFLAESTVKNHLSAAFAKLAVRSRKEAVEAILDAEHGYGIGILDLGAEPEALQVRDGSS